MRRLLHIVTKSNDDLADSVIETHRQTPEFDVRVIDMTDSKPNYRELLEEIFAADSIQVW